MACGDSFSMETHQNLSLAISKAYISHYCNKWNTQCFQSLYCQLNTKALLPKQRSMLLNFLISESTENKEMGVGIGCHLHPVTGPQERVHKGPEPPLPV